MKRQGEYLLKYWVIYILIVKQKTHVEEQLQGKLNEMNRTHKLNEYKISFSQITVFK